MQQLIRTVLGQELTRFVVTGVAAAGLFALLSFVLLSAGTPPFAAALAAYGVTVVASYTAQRSWTFRGRHRHGEAFPRYVAAQLCCAAVTAAVAQVLSHLGLSAAGISLSTTLVGSALSFCLSRYWVFPPSRRPGA